MEIENDLFPEDSGIKDYKKILRNRAFASIVDYWLFVLLSLFLPFVLFPTTKTAEGVRYHAKGIATLLPILLWIFYFVATEFFFSATPGKFFLGIKVVSQDGSKLTLIQALKRRLTDFIEILWCFGLVAYITALNNPYNKRIGDKWANTMVIRR